MKVICIDDKNRPINILPSEWIKEGETYTITKIVNMGLQDGKYGVLLKEVQLRADSFPYEYYDADRFVPLDIRVYEQQEKQEEVLEADLDLI
jgi:hypothetical protein